MQEHGSVLLQGPDGTTTTLRHPIVLNSTPDGTEYGLIVRVVGAVTANERRTTTAPTQTSVASSASSVTIFASNANAIARRVRNDSTQNLYLEEGGAAATTASTIRVTPGWYYEFPSPLYTGIVTGIWAAANGNARLTELT